MVGQEARIVSPRELLARLRDWSPLAFPLQTRKPKGFHIAQALVIEEMAILSSPAARELVRFASESLRLSKCEKIGMAAALDIGAAAVLVDACYEEARRKGIMGSLLLDFRKVQNELADAAAELASVRVQTYRALVLLDKGKDGQGFRELCCVSERAGALITKMLKLAASIDTGPMDARTSDGQDFQKGRGT